MHRGMSKVLFHSEIIALNDKKCGSIKKQNLVYTVQPDLRVDISMKIDHVCPTKYKQSNSKQLYIRNAKLINVIIYRMRLSQATYKRKIHFFFYPILPPLEKCRRNIEQRSVKKSSVHQKHHTTNNGKEAHILWVYL